MALLVPKSLLQLILQAQFSWIKRVALVKRTDCFHKECGNRAIGDRKEKGTEVLTLGGLDQVRLRVSWRDGGTRL